MTDPSEEEADSLEIALSQLEPETWLRNPLQTSTETCGICHGFNWGKGSFCPACCRHHEEVGPSLLSDVIIPISYSLSDMQLNRYLHSYKNEPPTLAAQASVERLLYTFLALHKDCIQSSASGYFTHFTTVPSTKTGSNKRTGLHPLIKLTQGLPWPRVKVETVPGAFGGGDDRELDQNGFMLPEKLESGARVLLIEDTWVTGARPQSLAYTLKSAGAALVVTLVIGRRIDVNFYLGREHTESIRKSPQFDPYTCLVHTAPAKRQKYRPYEN